MSLKKQNTVAYLKKEAKKLRKNNPALKNHADSLNAKAKELGYKSHQELLDNAFILPKRDVEKLKEKEILIKQINDLFKEYSNLKLSGKEVPPFLKRKAFLLAEKYRSKFSDYESNPEIKNMVYTDIILGKDKVSRGILNKSLRKDKKKV